MDWTSFFLPLRLRNTAMRSLSRLIYDSLRSFFARGCLLGFASMIETSSGTTALTFLERVSFGCTNVLISSMFMVIVSLWHEESRREMITSTKKKPQYNATRILAIAPSQYGKSSLINEWALRKIKEKVFHPSRIVLISPTHRSDPVLADLIAICKKKVPTWLEDNAFEHLDSRAEEALLMIYESQKAIKIAIAEGLTNVTLHHYLVLCDDVIGESMMKQRKNNPLDLIATTGRHQNISTVVSL